MKNNISKKIPGTATLPSSCSLVRMCACFFLPGANTGPLVQLLCLTPQKSRLYFKSLCLNAMFIADKSFNLVWLTQEILGGGSMTLWDLG